MDFLDELAGFGLPGPPPVACFDSFGRAVEHCEAAHRPPARAGFRDRRPVLKVNRF